MQKQTACLDKFKGFFFSYSPLFFLLFLIEKEKKILYQGEGVISKEQQPNQFIYKKLQRTRYDFQEHLNVTTSDKNLTPCRYYQMQI